MNKKKSIDLIFFILLITLIIFSCIYKINTGHGEIGISADTLGVGDRSFYINDNYPFGDKGYQDFKGGPLYPKILEIASFISIKIFGQNSTSTIWNVVVISFSALSALATSQLLYLTGRVFGGYKVGNTCMLIYVICPYTYYYVLGGGITNYTLLGCTALTYAATKLWQEGKQQDIISIKYELCILLGSMIALAYLRPSSSIFSFVAALVIFLKLIFQEKKSKGRFKKNVTNVLYLISTLVILISLQQIYETFDYSLANINGSLAYGGSYFGYPRDLLREKINILTSSSDVQDIIKGYAFRLSFVITDFLAGINGIRDTFTATSHQSIFSFLARIFTGIFYLVPLSTFSLTSIIIFREKIFRGGFVIPLLAAFAAIATSLFGCSLSKYYFMFISPFIILSAFYLEKSKAAVDIEIEKY
tara:strand:+ start:257 stop:1510 length:1254 start_codon:yes stop_codon:yes gene_type:complete